MQQQDKPRESSKDTTSRKLDQITPYENTRRKTSIQKNQEDVQSQRILQKFSQRDRFFKDPTKPKQHQIGPFPEVEDCDENFGGSEHDMNAMRSSRHYTNNINVQRQDLINRRSGRSLTPSFSQQYNINTGQRSLEHNRYKNRNYQIKNLKIIDSNSISSFGDQIALKKATVQKVEFESKSNCCSDSTVPNELQGIQKSLIQKQKNIDITQPIWPGDSDSQEELQTQETIGVHKKQFRNLFGLQLDIPAFYVLDGRFYPGNLDYQILIVKFQMPERSEQKFVTHKFNKGYMEYPEEQDWDEFCSKDKYEKLQLLLLKNNNNCLNVVSKIKIDALEQVNIEFSEDGKFIAIFYIEESILEFYQIDNNNIQATLEKVKGRDHTFIIESHQFQHMIFNKIKFSNRYFALFGPKHACVIDLHALGQPQICQKYFLDTRLYSDIMDLNVAEKCKKEGTIKCEVACLVNDQKKIHVFSIFSDDCNFNEKGSKSITFVDSSLRKNINDAKVKISQDFSQVLLAYKDENYMIKRDKS